MGKINVYYKIMIENQKKMKIWKSKKFTQISIWKIVYKWNSQLAKASWCHRECWRHLPYMWRISL